MASTVTSGLPVESAKIPLPDFQPVCPSVGLTGDAATHARTATDLHRCYHDFSHPRPVSEMQQIRYCLGPGYPECPLLRGVERPAQRRGMPRPLVAIAVTGLVIALFAASLATVAALRGGLSKGDSEPEGAPELPAAAAVATNTPPGAGAAVSTNASVAATTTTAAPTPVTTTPSPAAAPRPKSYTVQVGDSYNLIAGRFGITLDELLRANGRTVNTALFPNTVLQIP